MEAAEDMGYDEPWDQAIDPAHGELEALAPNLWWVWSRMRNPPLCRNMVVARLGDGSLWVHSPVCLPEAAMATLDGWGPVKWLVVPNEGHRIDIRRYRSRYPEAKVIAPAAARRKVEEIAPVDDTCEHALPPVGVRIHDPDGMKSGYELVYELDLDGGGKALVVNDVLGDRHPHGATGFSGAMMGLLGTPGGQLGQPRIVRFFFGKDRAAFRGFVQRLAGIDGVKVLTTSHGAPVRGDVAGALRGAAARI